MTRITGLHLSISKMYIWKTKNDHLGSLTYVNFCNLLKFENSYMTNKCDNYIFYEKKIILFTYNIKIE